MSISLAFAIPAVVITPIAGGLADRYSRRNIILAANVFGMIAAALIPLLMLLDKLPFAVLLTLLGCLSIKTAFHNSAFDASTIMLVPKDQLPRANGLMQTTWALSSIVAPPLTAVLISLPALARQGTFGIPTGLGQLQSGTPIALCFGVISLFLGILPLPFLQIPSPCNNGSGSNLSKPSMAQELWAGFSFVWHRKPLLWLLLAFATTNFAYSPIEVFRPVILRFSLAADYASKGYTFETALALLGTLQGIGTLAGGILVSTWGGLKTKRVFGVIFPIILFGMSLSFFGFSSAFYLTSSIMLVIGSLVPVMNVHSQAIWQTQTPPELQGRVFAFRRVIAQFTAPIGTAIAGWAGGIFSPGSILIVLGLFLIAFGVSQCFNNKLLTIEEPGMGDSKRVSLLAE